MAFEAMLGKDGSDLGGKIGAGRRACGQVETQAQSLRGQRDPPEAGSRFRQSAMFHGFSDDGTPCKSQTSRKFHTLFKNTPEFRPRRRLIMGAMEQWRRFDPGRVVGAR